MTCTVVAKWHQGHGLLSLALDAGCRSALVHPVYQIASLPAHPPSNQGVFHVAPRSTYGVLSMHIVLAFVVCNAMYISWYYAL